MILSTDWGRLFNTLLVGHLINKVIGTGVYRELSFPLIIIMKWVNYHKTVSFNEQPF